MKLLLKLFINTLAVLITAYLLKGIELDSVFTALVVAVVLGILNTIIKPVLMILTLPINIITLGLFTLVINGLMVLLASYLIPNFVVATLIDALLFSVLLSIISSFLGLFAH
jgi:putative membrane protein